MKTMEIPTAERLKNLGFYTAGVEMERHKEIVSPELKQKLRTAFEFYRVVEPHHLAQFTETLRRKTRKTKRWVTKGTYGGRDFHTLTTWMQPAFETIHNYSAAPPVEVLEKLEEAKNRNCFDRFEVMSLKLATKHGVERRYPDPILFGRINNSDNYYVIAEWGNDVSIKDILSEDEG